MRKLDSSLPNFTQRTKRKRATTNNTIGERVLQGYLNVFRYWTDALLFLILGAGIAAAVWMAMTPRVVITTPSCCEAKPHHHHDDWHPPLHRCYVDHDDGDTDGDDTGDTGDDTGDTGGGEEYQWH